MNDYLSRAIERETSPAPAVRPALPSFFEPAPPSALTNALETESLIEGDPSRNTPDETESKLSPLHEPLTAVDALWPHPATGAPGPPEQGEKAAGKSSAGLAATPIAPAATAAFSTELSPAKPRQLPGAAATEPAGRPTAETPPEPLRAATQGIVRPTRGAPPKPVPVATEGIVRPTDGAPPKPPQAATQGIARPKDGAPPKRPQAATQGVVRRAGIPQPRPIYPAAEELVRPVSESPSREVGEVPTIGERALPSPTASPARSAPGSGEPKSTTPPAPTPLTKVVAPAHATIPRISPAPSSREPARSADNPFSPRPVHITIGRIEVRAVHPPPQPVRRRPAPAAPKISLEEYLKQRHGGRR